MSKQSPKDLVMVVFEAIDQEMMNLAERIIQNIEKRNGRKFENRDEMIRVQKENLWPSMGEEEKKELMDKVGA